MASRRRSTFTIAFVLATLLIGRSYAQAPVDAVTKLLKDFEDPTKRHLVRPRLLRTFLDQLRGKRNQNDASATEGLVEMLSHKDKTLAANAAFCISDAASALNKQETAAIESLRSQAGKRLRFLLDDSSYQLRFAATKALGALWAGNEGKDPECLQVNGRLYGMALASTDLAEAFSAASALAMINTRFKVDLAKWPDSGLSAKNEAAVVDHILGDWRQKVVEGRRSGLFEIPPRNELDWRSLVQFVITGDTAERQAAKEEIVSRGSLNCIDYVIDHVQMPRVRQEVLSDLSEIVSRLTGAELKLERGMAEDARVKLVEQWKAHFLVALRNIPKSRSLPYIDARIEHLRSVLTAEAAEEVRKLQNVLPWLVNDRAEIPQSLPPDVIERLTRDLEIKDECRKQVVALQQPGEANTAQRVRAAKTIRERMLTKENNKVIVRIFVRDFCEVLAVENNQLVFDDLRAILDTVVPEPPLEIKASDRREKRIQQLQEWLKKIGEKPLVLEGAP